MNMVNRVRKFNKAPGGIKYGFTVHGLWSWQAMFGIQQNKHQAMAKPSIPDWRILGFAAAVALMAGCASVPDDPIEREVFLEANDPFEPMNRAIFAFNIQIDRIALEPLANGYRATVPQFGRDMLDNFLFNLKLPVIFINDILQGNPMRAYETAVRFVVNSTVGIGGLFDASQIERHEEDLGQTLAAWGIKEGPYIVLPIFGPSNLRDFIGQIGDQAFDPIAYAVNPGQAKGAFYGRTLVGGVDSRSQNIEAYNELERTSLDLYSTFRSLYRQSREFEIRNGAPARIEAFSFDDIGSDSGAGPLKIVITRPR